MLGKQRRGFTVLELAVSLTVFAVIAGITTLAVGRAQLTAATSRLEQAVRSELSSLVATTATASYTQITDQSFTRPEPCPRNSALSCMTVLGREFEVQWSVTASPDLADLSVENPSAVELSATTTLPGNRSVTVTRVVSSPNAGRDASTGLLRVRSDGASYDGPVYLMRQADTEAGETSEQVSASGVVTNGIALLRADAADCPTSAPCRLALAPNGATRSGDVTMDTASAVGSASQIVLTADAVAEAGIVMRAVPQIRVGLLGVSSDGQRGYPTEAGSVCTWLSFTDDKTTRSVPACNSPAPGSVLYTTYTPDPAKPLQEVAIPTSATLTLTADKPDGSCPNLTALGQKSWTGTAWTSGSPCTSWTWGPIGGVAAGRSPTATTSSASFRPTGVVSEHQAVWNDTDLARPATGLGTQAPWQYPRIAQSCATDSTCTPPASSPETAAGCPSGQCLSGTSLGPYVATPRNTGTWTTTSVYAPAGSITLFTLTVDDPDPGATVTATATAVPAGLNTVTYDEDGNPVYTEVTTSQILMAAVPSGTQLPLAYQPESESAGVPLTVQLTDQDGNARTETIWLWSTRERDSGYPTTGIVRQGQTTPLTLTVIDQAGDPSTSPEGLTPIPPEGSSLSTWEPSGAGTITATFDAGTAAAGQYDIPVTVSSRQAVLIPITILPSAGAISVTGTGGPQAGNGTANVSVLDKSGTPMPDADVRFSIVDQATGNTALGVYANPRGCRTGEDGTCAVPLTIERAAAPGNYQIVATTETLTAESTPITVTSVVSSVEPSGVTMAQDDTGSSDVLVEDGRGLPAEGVTLTVTDVPEGVSASVTAPTDGGGHTNIEITTSPSARAGAYQLRVNAPGGASGYLGLVVTPVVGSISAEPVSVPQGGVSTIEITALDTAGDPAVAVPITVSSTSDVKANASATTNTSGIATISLTAATNASLVENVLTVSSAGTSVGTLPVTIRQGVASAVTSGTLVRGETGIISIALRDHRGKPVTNREFTLTPESTLITPTSSTGTTNEIGVAELSISAAPGAAPTFTTLTVNVDGRAIKAGVLVR